MGTGITTGSLLLHRSLERVDLVEIEEAVLEASDQFVEFNHSPLKDPRTHVIIQDGRTYVAFARKQYDLITSDPIHPWVKGAGNLYTREYYARAVHRLNPDGIFCQWIPSTMSVAAFHSILKSLHSAFPHVSFLFAEREVVALGSMSPITVDEARIREEMSDPDVAKSLAQMRLGDADRVIALLKSDLHPINKTRYQNAVLNTDDNIYLEHRLPWDTFHGHVVQLRPPKRDKK
jgi:spermidine synthase